MPNWVRTLREILPEAPVILRSLKPTYHLDSAASLSTAFLSDAGIEALLLDVDGTIMAYHALEVAGELTDALAPHLEGHGLPTAIVSNCDEGRFNVLGELFPSVPVVRAYLTPEGTVCRVLRGRRDSHDRASIDRLLADPRIRPARKPNPALLRCALEILGVRNLSRALMVGDQYLTDVAAANRAGIRSAKVPTCRSATFPAVLRWGQRFERALFLALYSR